MRTQNKGTRSSRFRITTIAIAVASSFAMTSAWAADSDIVDKGAQAIAYDISPVNDGTNIAIGKNAKVFIGGGTQESMLSFGEDVSFTNHGLSMNIHSNTAAKQNLPSGIAVGTNTYARTASIQIGDHTLEKTKLRLVIPLLTNFVSWVSPPQRLALIPIQVVVLPRRLAAITFSPANTQATAVWIL